jgi:acetyl-CoA acetyltransferase
MSDAAVVGVGLTRFGKFPDRSLKDLAAEAVQAALKDAGIDGKDIGAAFGSNSLAGLLTGQECVRTQTVLAPLGIRGIPVVNVENACASGSTAFRLAVQAVASGEAPYALAVGFEKMSHPDKERTFAAIGAASDVEEAPQHQAGRSSFMDIYAAEVREHMERHGSTAEDFALVAVKNHYHGSLNPFAQYRNEVTVDEVLSSPAVVHPLTRLMCSPIGDGAAALVIGRAERHRRAPVVAATVLRSGAFPVSADHNDTVEAAAAAYEQAGLGPDDMDVAEVHDAAAPAELIACEDLRLAPPGGGAKLVREGATRLGGRIPVNPSGGLESRGHPLGATGVAMIGEIALHLRGDAGPRQVEGARIGLVHNSGGLVAGSPAAVAVHILRQP